MGGSAVWTYVGMLFVAGLPTFVLRSGTTILRIQGGQTWTDAYATATTVASVLLTGVLICALRATAYRQRLGSTKNELGEVFA